MKPWLRVQLGLPCSEMAGWGTVSSELLI
uniref:Uncharacterized protein n=1 Tax=Anguilla anguilla TaxID=7936 RepID=A0A0E9RX05_ANGAN